MTKPETQTTVWPTKAQNEDYYLAKTHAYTVPSHAGGTWRRYAEGPYQTFDPEWMNGDRLVFLEAPGIEPRIAVAEMIEHAGRMSKSIFLLLQRKAEQMDLAAAKGEDATPGFDTKRAAIHALLDAAPWTMHPDHGCVSLQALGSLEARHASAPEPGM